MTMPGFTAEAALLRTRNQYYVAGPRDFLAGDRRVSPQFVLPPPCTCHWLCDPVCRPVCYCRLPPPLSSGPLGTSTW
jgi:hypothetical protein